MSFIIKGFRTIVFIFIVISTSLLLSICVNNNKYEDNSPKTLNDKNQQASSKKFRQLKWVLAHLKIVLPTNYSFTNPIYMCVCVCVCALLMRPNKVETVVQCSVCHM